MNPELTNHPALSPEERLLLDVYAQSDPVGPSASPEAIDRQRSLDRWMQMRERTLRHRRRLRSAGFASAAAVLLCAGHTALVWNGEREVRTAGTHESAAQIEEILVTARKREENLQQTPVSITAFSEADLRDRDIRRIQEVTQSVPPLKFDAAISQSNSARVYPRDAGNVDPVSSDEKPDFGTVTRDRVTDEIADLPRPEPAPVARRPLQLKSPITIAPPSAERLRELQAQPGNDVAAVVPRLEPGSVEACEQEHVDAAVPAGTSDPTRRGDARCPSQKP